MAARDGDRVIVDLSKKSYAEAIDFLRSQATVLDYTAIGVKGREILNNAAPGVIPGLTVKNKKGELESVIFCTT
ncbi:hypothetical protein M758_12G189900, partial [Ceratodon purpureus]